MRNTNKKGFTIVELVIVVAVIAILAAVLIPTFSGIIRKANESKDTQLVKNLNTALAADVNGDKTIVGALAAAAEFGYDVAKINASATDNEILWDSVNNVFCYLNDGVIEYIDGSEHTVENAKYWVIDDEINTTYSTYYYGSANIDSDTSTSICLTTNGTDLVVDAPNADVYHYGDVANLTIEAVKSASYHEFGRVTQLAIVKKGHVKVENGGSIGAIVVAASDVELTGDFGIVMGTSEVLAAAKIPADVKKQTVESTDALDGVVAIVDGVLYDDFAEALAAANGKEVVLVRDVVFNRNIALTIAKDAVVTLDLNGHVINGVAYEEKTSAVIQNKGNLTIKDSVGGSKIVGSATDPDKQAIPGYASNTITNSGTLTLEGGTIENTTLAGAAYCVDNNSTTANVTFTMNGGKLVAARCALRMFCNSATNENNVIINNGEISGGTRGIWIQLPGSDNTKAAAGKLTINGGTITNNGNEDDCALYVYTYGNNHSATYITITGGTFNGAVCFGGGTYKGTQETVSITGGTFNGELGRYLENDGWEDIAKP